MSESDWFKRGPNGWEARTPEEAARHRARRLGADGAPAAFTVVDLTARLAAAEELSEASAHLLASLNDGRRLPGAVAELRGEGL